MSELKPFTGALDPPDGLKPFDGLADEEKSSITRRYIADPLLTAAKGVVGAGETLVGLADMPTLGYAGKALEQIGYRPKDTHQYIESFYSPEQQAANKAVNEAQGFIPTATAMLENPSTIAHGAIENLPSMLGGGAIARGLMKAVPKMSALTAGAIGEGLVTAGQNTEQVRQESPDGTLTPEQIALTGVSGALTGGISRASGGLAQKFGFQNLETMLAGGKLDANAPIRGPIARAVGGFLTEGALEELPQSAQEQVAQNLALGKPWDEGVGSAAAQGLLLGGAMGAGGNVLFGQRRETTAPPSAPGTTPPPAGTPPAAPPTVPPAAAPLSSLIPPENPITQAAVLSTETGAAAEAQAGRAKEAAAAEQPAAGPVSEALAPIVHNPEEGFTPENAATRKAAMEAQTGLVHNIVPHPLQSQKFAVQPTALPAPPNVEEQKAATKEAEAEQKAVKVDLDKRINTFKDEAKALAQRSKETKGEGEPQLPAIQKALMLVSDKYWDSRKAADATETAIKEKRNDVAYAILERAEIIAAEAEAKKPLVPETHPMYQGMLKWFQKEAKAARGVADKIKEIINPGGENAVQVPSTGGVLPYAPSGTGEAGSVGGGVGQGEQRVATTQASQAVGQAAAPVVGQAENVQGNSPDVSRSQTGAGGKVGPEPNPTPAQIEAGNYKKEHIVAAGHPITIENKEGMVRRSSPGVAPSWERTIQKADYGYIKRTEGNDGDHVDAFVKPGTPPEHAGPVFVIDQQGKDGKFDEHKVMVGYANQIEAVSAYKANYPSGWSVGPVTETTNENLKDWLKNGDMKQPFSERKSDPLDQLVEHDVYEVDDSGKMTGNVVRAKIPARQALADIDERHEFAQAMLECLGT